MSKIKNIKGEQLKYSGRTVTNILGEQQKYQGWTVKKYQGINNQD